MVTNIEKFLVHRGITVDSKSLVLRVTLQCDLSENPLRKLVSFFLNTQRGLTEVKR